MRRAVIPRILPAVVARLAPAPGRGLVAEGSPALAPATAAGVGKGNRPTVLPLVGILVAIGAPPWILI